MLLSTSSGTTPSYDTLSLMTIRPLGRRALRQRSRKLTKWLSVRWPIRWKKICNVNAQVAVLVISFLCVFSLCLNTTNKQKFDQWCHCHIETLCRFFHCIDYKWLVIYLSHLLQRTFTALTCLFTNDDDASEWCKFQRTLLSQWQAQNIGHKDVTPSTFKPIRLWTNKAKYSIWLKYISLKYFIYLLHLCF